MQKRVIKEQKEKLDEIGPAGPAIGSAIASFAPKIIKGVASLITGDDDAEEHATALVDKSQLDPVVIKSKNLENIQQILRSIEAKISDLSAAQSKDDQASPAYQKSMSAEKSSDQSAEPRVER